VVNNRSLSLIVYGPSKVGKTTLANSTPGPRLFLDAEGGTKFLPGKKIIWDPMRENVPELGDWETCIVYVRDYATLERAYQWLASGKHPFRSVILDSLSEAQQKCVDAIAGKEQMKIQDWGALFRTVGTMARQLRDLTVHPTKPLDAVVIVCMTRDSSSGIKQPYVQGQLSITLPFYFDVIGYLFTQNAEDGTLVRRLLTSPAPGYEAGDRTGRLGAVMDNPRVDTMLDIIYGKEDSQ
jgi:hypothetical protein